MHCSSSVHAPFIDHLHTLPVLIAYRIWHVRRGVQHLTDGRKDAVHQLLVVMLESAGFYSILLLVHIILLGLNSLVMYVATDLETPTIGIVVRWLSSLRLLASHCLLASSLLLFPLVNLSPLVNHPLLVNDSPVRTPSLTHPLQFSYIIVRVSEGVAHGNTSSGGPTSGGETSGPRRTWTSGARPGVGTNTIDVAIRLETVTHHDSDEPVSETKSTDKSKGGGW